MWISVFAVYACLSLPPASPTDKSSFAGKAPLPNAAKASKTKPPLWKSQSLVRNTPFTSPVNRFDTYLKYGGPSEIKLPENRQELNELVPRPQKAPAAQRKPRLRIPQANPAAKLAANSAPVTPASNILQWTFPQARDLRPARGNLIMGVDKQARRMLQPAKMKKISARSHKKGLSKKPQWRNPRAHKEWPVTPSISDSNKKSNSSNVRIKGHFKIPNANMQPSDSSLGVIKSPVTPVPTVNEIISSVRGNAMKDPGEELYLSARMSLPGLLKDFSFSVDRSWYSTSPLFPTMAYTAPQTVDQDALRTDSPPSELSFLLGLRQLNGEKNDRYLYELKDLIMRQIDQVVYTTQTEHVPVVEGIASKYSQDLRFRMAFIFLRIDEIKHEMHTMYSYLKKNLDSYPWWRFWQSYYKINQRVQLLYYTHFLRKNVDVTYAIEYLLELCQSTDDQTAAYKKLGQEVRAMKARRAGPGAKPTKQMKPKAKRG